MTKIPKNVGHAFDKNGILASFDFCYEIDSDGNMKSSKAVQTLQVYNKEQLIHLLKANRFKTVRFTTIEGDRISKTKSERILIVARK